MRKLGEMIIHVWAHSTHGLIWLYYAHECVHLVNHVDVLSINLLPLEALNQHAVTRSLTEAEYKALTDSPAEILWIQSLLSDLYFSSDPITIFWCDNLGVTYLSVNPIFHARTKHVEVDYHFIRDRVTKKKIAVRFISSQDQLADVLTKPLPTRPSLIFGPNFMWILLLQLERAYYGMILYLPYIGF